MRLSEPRVAPLADEDLPARVKEIFGDRPLLNIFRTLAHHPEAMERWLVFGHHVLANSTLAPRQRELVILRIAWLCRSGYGWGQHVVIGLASGLTEGEIERIPEGAKAEGWSELDRALLDATDELHADAFISDATWERLGELSVQQRLDLVFAVGQYTLASMILNTLGVQPDPGLPQLPTGEAAGDGLAATTADPSRGARPRRRA